MVYPLSIDECISIEDIVICIFQNSDPIVIMVHVKASDGLFSLFYFYGNKILICNVFSFYLLFHLLFMILVLYIRLPKFPGSNFFQYGLLKILYPRFHKEDISVAFLSVFLLVFAPKYGY